MSDLRDLAKEVDAVMEAGSLRFNAMGISGVHNPTSPATNIKPKNCAFTTINFARVQQLQPTGLQEGPPCPIGPCPQCSKRTD